MTTFVLSSNTKATEVFSLKVAAVGEPAIVARHGYEQCGTIDAKLFCGNEKETPEKHLARLLEEADRDIESEAVSDARNDLSCLRERYGL